ncbi:MAG: 3-dehydroquinate synthase [Candidatus Margulisiibacteriota bacterium]
MTRSLKTYFINNSTGKKFPIIFGETAYEMIDSTDLTGATKALIVTNKTIAKLCNLFINELKMVLDLDVVVLEIEDGERYKKMDTVTHIIDACLDHQMGRKDVLLAFGGGVVGDMAGFAASIYLRGIRFFQIPTTLLAQVDAAIGGKTGVNHASGKNLIGTFCQPSKILIDPTLLATLSKEQMKEGLAEIIKYGVIMDKPLFWYIEEHMDPISRFCYKDCPDIWHFLIEKSIQNKAKVVSQDEKESELREILNYGHTIGHAIELAFSYQGVSHGQAVAQGMVVEAQMALKLKHISEDDFNRIKQLIDSFQYDFSLDNINRDVFFDALLKDKKVRQGQVRFVIPIGLGSTKTIQGVSEDIIRDAFNHSFGKDVL